jgi:5'(3')-deoxyribonucleotidase
VTELVALPANSKRQPKTRRARFGIDVDGVMYQFQKTALYMLNTMRGYDLKLEEFTYWNQPKDRVKNNDWQWLWSGGVKDGLFRYGHLYKGTIEAIRVLNVLGDVVIITHRPRNAVQDTLDWLAYLRLPFMETHLLTDGQPKSAIKCDLYVDDKPENIEDFDHNTDGLALLWDRPWNHDSILELYSMRARRVETWQDVIDYAQQVTAERIISD